MTWWAWLLVGVVPTAFAGLLLLLWALSGFARAFWR